MPNFKAILVALAIFLPYAANAQSVHVQATWTGSVSVPGVHTLNGFVTTDSWPTGVWVILVDSASVPSSGALASAPPGCFYVPPTVSPALNTMLGMANVPVSVSVQNGLVAVLSSTSCGANGSGAETYTPVAGYLSVTYQ